MEDGTMDPLPSLLGPTTETREGTIAHYKYYGENRSYLDDKSERNDGCR